MSKLLLNVKYLLSLSLLTAVKFYNLGLIQGIIRVNALTQKRSFFVICTTFRSALNVGWKNQNKHSTLNLSFDALSKWHEPGISSRTGSPVSREIVTHIFCENILVWWLVVFVVIFQFQFWPLFALFLCCSLHYFWTANSLAFFSLLRFFCKRTAADFGAEKFPCHTVKPTIGTT